MEEVRERSCGFECGSVVECVMPSFMEMSDEGMSSVVIGDGAFGVIGAAFFCGVVAFIGCGD